MDVDTIISLSLNVSGSSCGTIGMKALFFYGSAATSESNLILKLSKKMFLLPPL